MKRVFTVLLVAALLVGALSANMVSYVQAAGQIAGDLNGDGKVNNRDLGLLQQLLNGWDVTIEGSADVNGDGAVNNKDLGLLQQALNSREQEVRLSGTTASSYVELGAPAAALYSSNGIARIAWDMAIYDGQLYVGCGDFGANSGTNDGATSVISCPLDNVGNWSTTATVKDEQVGRFININGRFLIPGFDPLGRPQKGYFYELIDGQWETHAVLPYGLHNFDVAWFQGRMYAAIGSARGDYSVAYTEDGVNYSTISFYKDGALLDTGKSDVVRSCNLYVLGDILCADFWYASEESERTIFEMYRYNEELDGFEYVADLKTSTHGGLYGEAGLPIFEKAALGDRMFLTTGYLYWTTDFVTYNEVSIPNNAIVYDMIAYENGRMYLLTADEIAGGYEIAIYSMSESNPTALRTEATFFYEQMPTAFAMDEDNFFIGTGDWNNKKNQDNGMILQIER